MTIIATGFSQTFEENLWGGGKSQVNAMGPSAPSPQASNGAPPPGGNGQAAGRPAQQQAWQQQGGGNGAGAPAGAPAAQPQRRGWW